MDYLPFYVYWILGGNLTSLKGFPPEKTNLPEANADNIENKQDYFLRVWKTFSPPIDYRRPVQTDETHDLRKPVELAHDFNLRRPAMPEESHDLRWPVLEEDSHDLRNPGHELSPPVTDDNIEVDKQSEDSFWRHDKINIDEILGKEQVMDKCVDEFLSTEHHESNSSYSRIREASIKVCGKSIAKTVPRLVGGESSEYLQWPWMVSVRQRHRKKYQHKCGAALLNKWWVVTAAHCVEWQPKRYLLLRLGNHNLNDENEPHPYEDKSVDIKIIHEDFNPITFENDIALLRMATPAEFRLNMAPLCLAEDLGDLVGKMAVVLGWGRVTERGFLSGTLQEAYLPLISSEECGKMYEEAGTNETMLDTFICAGMAEGGVDACDGDSGGPLSILDRDGRWSLIGIVSWGKVCGGPNQPGVYTRTDKYLKWIEGNMACNTH